MVEFCCLLGVHLISGWWVVFFLSFGLYVFVDWLAVLVFAVGICGLVVFAVGFTGIVVRWICVFVGGCGLLVSMFCYYCILLWVFCLGCLFSVVLVVARWLIGSAECFIRCILL